MNIEKAAMEYLRLGFTPLPVRDFLKFPAHLRISEKTVEELEDIARTTTFSTATGVWLLLHERPREDGNLHVAVDFDFIPEHARDILEEMGRKTFGYYTARGIHLHFLIPKDEIPLNRRMSKVFVGNRQVADLFIFAPADDKSFTDSWRRGVLAYPSAARDTHSDDGQIVERKLIGTELKPPMKISWAEFEDFIRRVYGENASIGAPHTATPRISKISFQTNRTIQVSGTVSQRAARILRMMSQYVCVSNFLPTVSEMGVITAAPSMMVGEGNRNNTLLALLAVANRVAAPLTVDDILELAHVLNKFVCDPPLPQGEVIQVVQSVVGKGYEMKPITFAESAGLTHLCVACPYYAFCHGENLLEPEEPHFEQFPAEAYFPSEYFRGEMQRTLYLKLMDAVQNTNNRIILGIAPTGSGKTLHSTGLARMSVQMRRAPTVVLVPTKQLQNQHSNWLGAVDVPYVVFKGRANYPCPLLHLAKELVVRDHGEDVVDSQAEWNAASAPCSFGDAPTCSTVCYLLHKSSGEYEEDDKEKDEKLEKFAQAATASVMEHFRLSPVNVTKIAARLIENVCTVKDECSYLRMTRRLRSFMSGTPGVIVANQSLMFVARVVANARRTEQTPTLVILDEAHKLLDGIFAPFALRFTDPDMVDMAASVKEVVVNELQSAKARLEAKMEELDDAVQRGDRSRISKIRRRVQSLQRYIRNVGLLVDLVMTDPAAFAVDIQSKKVYVRVLKNRRASVLRQYLLQSFPNTQFILLTATGSELEPIADVVIKSRDVIPVKNRRVLYIPYGRFTQSSMRERTRKVYFERVAPTVVAQYNFLAPQLAEKFGVEKVRAVVHEVAKHRAIYLARAIAESGHTVLLYAGNKRDYESLPEDAKVDYEELQKMGNVTIIYSLEDAVGEFKTNPHHTFFVAVALDTGHDFDEDDIMLQWVVKVPYPSLGDPDYVLIEKADGPEERDKQYTYDTLMQLIQMAGRTTRKPEQYSMTIVLDTALENLLIRAWEFGFVDDVLSLAERIVVPKQYAGRLARLPEPIRERITLE